ncbi:MAG TPA: hypothetical protein VFE46_00575 [Pirellulales bacterium]|jgi:hypothetical protein|nr:hypothetical protein [Pirellulales bacterium]
MSAPFSSAAERAHQFAQSRNIELVKTLGSGVNGQVWSSTRLSAVKVFDRQMEYEREWVVYARLAELEVDRINEFEVPQLLAWDDELRVIEISLVRPPYILDFAGAYLDRPPDFPAEALAEQHQNNRELFGTHWPRVSLILAKLRSMGIYYIDINRGNIRLPEFDEEAEPDF